ncbi:hypothetical protein BH09ACT13_BH09ACT13_06840 [soil metagenome]
MDVSLLFPNGKPVFIERKCETGRNALGRCSWDAVKLAFALQTGEASAAYLLAATTVTDWEMGIRGAELLETAFVDTMVPSRAFLRLVAIVGA